MKIFAMDWESKKHEIDVDVEDVTSVDVTVVSGDEILSIVTKSGIQHTYDAGVGRRIMNFYDGEYTVTEKKLGEWMGRKSSYEWLWRDERDDF